MKKGVDKVRNIVYTIYRKKEREEKEMTKKEMIKEMFEKGYASQYTPKDFEEWFTEEQIKRFYDNFMKHLEEVE